VTLQQALTQARMRLAACPDVADPILESEVLLRYTLHLTRAQLHLDLHHELDASQALQMHQWTERRCQGEPLAYIIGCREFFGLDFYVDSRVLIPRPETELLVEEALRISRQNPQGIIADIGTGSGAIAVSLAKSLPRVKIYAVDISAAALEVAAINSRNHGVTDRLILLQGDLLDPLPEKAGLILANLPYVPRTEWQAMPSAKYEPELALNGGDDGLDQVFRLGRQLNTQLAAGGSALLEIGLGQDRAVTAFFHRRYPSASIETLPDLAGIPRVVKLRLFP